jgi:hypothetical protein
MTNDRTPRLRRAPLPDEAVLVVRGDVLDDELLRADAARDIQTLVVALIGCPHQVRDNPYHENRGGQMNTAAVDLPVDLNGEDDTGLPWGFLDESQNPSKITEGAWIIAGSSRTQVVAQVVDICDGIVHVRPLPGSVASHRSLLTSVASSA